MSAFRPSLSDRAPLFVAPYMSIITSPPAMTCISTSAFQRLSATVFLFRHFLGISVICNTPLSCNAMLQCVPCFELSRPRLDRSLHRCPGPTAPWSKNRALYMPPHVHLYRLSYKLFSFFGPGSFLTSVFHPSALLLAAFDSCFCLCNTRPACSCSMLT